MKTKSFASRIFFLSYHIILGWNLVVVSLKTGSTSSLINAFTMKPSSSSSYYSTIISLRLNSDWKSWTVDSLATRQSASLLWLKSSSKINQPGGEEVPLIPSIPSSHPKGSQHTPRKRQTTGKLPSNENKSILRGENKNQGRQPGKTSSSRIQSILCRMDLVFL